jgi:hypothetical protein
VAETANLALCLYPIWQLTGNASRPAYIPSYPDETPVTPTYALQYSHRLAVDRIGGPTRIKPDLFREVANTSHLFG